MFSKHEERDGNSKDHETQAHLSSEFSGRPEKRRTLRAILRHLFLGDEDEKVQLRREKYKKPRRILTNILLVFTFLFGGGGVGFVGLHIGEVLGYIVKNQIDLTTREGLKHFIQNYLAKKFNYYFSHIEEGMFLTLVDLVDDYGVGVLKRIDFPAFFEGSDRAQATLLYARYYEDMTQKYIKNESAQNDSSTSDLVQAKKQELYVWLTENGSVEQNLSIQQDIYSPEISQYLNESSTGSLSLLMLFLDEQQKAQIAVQLPELEQEIALLVKQHQKSEYADDFIDLLYRIDRKIVTWMTTVIFGEDKNEATKLIIRNFSQQLDAVYYYVTFDQYLVFLDTFKRLPTETAQQFALSQRFLNELYPTTLLVAEDIDEELLQIIARLVSTFPLKGLPSVSPLPFSALDILSADAAYKDFLLRFSLLHEHGNPSQSLSSFLNLFERLEVRDFERTDIISQIENEGFEQFERQILSEFYISTVLPKVKDLLIDFPEKIDLAVQFESIFIDVLQSTKGAIDLLILNTATLDTSAQIIAQIITGSDITVNHVGLRTEMHDQFYAATLVALVRAEHNQISISSSTNDKIFYFLGANTVGDFQGHNHYVEIRQLLEDNPSAFYILIQNAAYLDTFSTDEITAVIEVLDHFAEDILASEFGTQTIMETNFFVDTLLMMSSSAANPALDFTYLFFLNALSVKGIEISSERLVSLPDNVPDGTWQLLFTIIQTEAMQSATNKKEVVLGLLKVMEVEVYLSYDFYTTLLNSGENLAILLDQVAHISPTIARFKSSDLLTPRDSLSSQAYLFHFVQHLFNIHVNEDYIHVLEEVIAEDIPGINSPTSLSNTVSNLVRFTGDASKMADAIENDYERQISELLSSIGVTQSFQDSIIDSLFKVNNTIPIRTELILALENINAKSSLHLFARNVLESTARENINPQVAVAFIDYSARYLEYDQVDQNWLSNYISYALPFFDEIAPNDFVFGSRDDSTKFLHLLSGALRIAFEQRPNDKTEFGKALVEFHYLFGLDEDVMARSSDRRDFFLANWESFVYLYNSPSLRLLFKYPDLAKTLLESQDDNLRDDIKVFIDSVNISIQDFETLMRSYSGTLDELQHPLRKIATFLRLPQIRSLKLNEKTKLVSNILSPTRMSIEQNFALILELLEFGMSPDDINKLWSAQFNTYGTLIVDYGAIETRLDSGGTIISLDLNPNIAIARTNVPEELGGDTLLFPALLFTQGLLYDDGVNLNQLGPEGTEIDVSNMEVTEFFNQYSNHHFLVSLPSEGGGYSVEVVTGSDFITGQPADRKLVDIIDEKEIEAFTVVNVIKRGDITMEDRVFLSTLASMTGYVDFLGVREDGSLVLLSLDDYKRVDDIFEVFVDIKALVLPDPGRMLIISQDLSNHSGYLNSLVIAADISPVNP